MPYQEVRPALGSGEKIRQANDFRELALHKRRTLFARAVEPGVGETANGEFTTLVESKSQLPGKTHS